MNGAFMLGLEAGGTLVEQLVRRLIAFQPMIAKENVQKSARAADGGLLVSRPAPEASRGVGH